MASISVPTLDVQNGLLTAAVSTDPLASILVENGLQINSQQVDADVNGSATIVLQDPTVPLQPGTFKFQFEVAGAACVAVATTPDGQSVSYAVVPASVGNLPSVPQKSTFDALWASLDSAGMSAALDKAMDDWLMTNAVALTSLALFGLISVAAAPLGVGFFTFALAEGVYTVQVEALLCDLAATIIKTMAKQEAADHYITTAQRDEITDWADGLNAAAQFNSIEGNGFLATFNALAVVESYTFRNSSTAVIGITWTKDLVGKYTFFLRALNKLTPRQRFVRRLRFWFR